MLKLCLAISPFGVAAPGMVVVKKGRPLPPVCQRIFHEWVEPVSDS